jgi:hypothetical protein
MSLAGIVYGNPSNQCWPMPMLFIYKQGTVRILQRPDRVLLIYTGPSTDVRHVCLNERHPEPLTPSWYGHSVGHYEGDTLVIDTVGVKTDRPYAMIDLFGTSYTKSLHVVERYRLREYDDVKDAIERNKKENWLLAEPWHCRSIGDGHKRRAQSDADGAGAGLADCQPSRRELERDREGVRLAALHLLRADAEPRPRDAQVYGYAPAYCRKCATTTADRFGVGRRSTPAADN